MNPARPSHLLPALALLLALAPGASPAFGMLPAGAAAAPAPAARPSEAAFAEAYRADLMDLDHPVFLGMEEAQILADHLGIGAEIYESAPAPRGSRCRRAIALRLALNEDLLDDFSPYRIYYKDQHFSVVKVVLEGEPADYADAEDCEGEVGGFAEVEAEIPGSGRVGRVPADGNCLITSLVFMETEAFPQRERIADLRRHVAETLTQDQLHNLVAEMRRDLLLNAEARPFEHGRFATWGRRTSALFMADPAFVAERERILAGHRAFYESKLSESKRPPTPPAEDDPDLALALAMSLSAPAPGPAVAAAGEAGAPVLPARGKRKHPGDPEPL